jgi:DNA polymerase I-like protein with 3'-5' exonuclease and polymerase domains
MSDMAYEMPNVRKMFIPDPDHILFEADLQGADAQIVAWEANDPKLKRNFRDKVDIHLANARDLYTNPALHKASSKEVKNTPALNSLRQKAKVFVHATNYGAKSATIASTLNISRHEAEVGQALWFRNHPEIAEWHRRIERQLQETRTVTNPFGYRRYYFERVHEILPQALAWVPQSTVAIIVNKGLVAVAEHYRKEVQILLQVHDSIVGQYHKSLHEEMQRTIPQLMAIPVPYDDPLTIPVSMKFSSENWGSAS